MLQILLKGGLISLLIICNIFVGIPLGPDALVILSWIIIASTSLASHKSKTNEFGTGLFKYSV